MHSARTQFPAGLIQPDQGYRFSLDALLLASFAAQSGAARTMLDLGAGCGVVGFSLIMDGTLQAAQVVGVDIDTEMTAAAIRNAELLELTDSCRFITLDVAAVRERPEIAAESFDLVVANPPYWRQGQGREPGHQGRVQARFERAGALEDFAEAAFYALKNHAAACLVYDARRLPDLLEALRAARLEPKRLRLVHPRIRQDARLVLMEARKNGRPELTVEPPLVLHQGHGTGTRLTPEALAFCPHLRRNPAQGGA